MHHLIILISLIIFLLIAQVLFNFISFVKSYNYILQISQIIVHYYKIFSYLTFYLNLNFYINFIVKLLNIIKSQLLIPLKLMANLFFNRKYYFFQIENAYLFIYSNFKNASRLILTNY